MIDYLNGVELELTEAEANYLNKDTLYVQRTIEPGVQVLQGMEALSYARMRKAEGDADSDIKRTERQRKLVASLLEKIRYMSLSELNEVTEEVMMDAIKAGHEEIKKLLTFMNGIVAVIGEFAVDGSGGVPFGDEGFKHGSFLSVGTDGGGT